MEPSDKADLQRQIDELVTLVAANRSALDALTSRADQSEARADAAELRVDEVVARSVVDREMIAELQADGVISRDNVAQLQRALETSRTIGAALGILMASRNIGQEQAFEVLKGASARSNTPMRQLAATIVAGADAIK